MERQYEIPVATRKQLITTIRGMANYELDHNLSSITLLQILGGLTLQQLQGLTETGKPGDNIPNNIPFSVVGADSRQVSVLTQHLLEYFKNLLPEQQQAAVSGTTFSDGGLTIKNMADEQKNALAESVVLEQGIKAVSTLERLRFSMKVWRLPNLPRNRSEAQVYAAKLRLHFTTDNTVAPCYFVIALAEEQPAASTIVQSVPPGTPVPPAEPASDVRSSLSAKP